MVAGCAKKDPLYCDPEVPCEDPALPFRDMAGEHPASEGVANTCIPDPFAAADGAVPDGPVADAGTDAQALECTAAGECDDSLFCNGLESCGGNGQCQAGTPPDIDVQVACTVAACSESTNQVTHQPDDAACSNQNLCGGVETCHPTQGCVSGTAVQCPADSACTVYSCVPSSGSCVANDAAYNISYTTATISGSSGLSCEESSAIIQMYTSTNCTETCRCQTSKCTRNAKGRFAERTGPIATWIGFYGTSKSKLPRSTSSLPNWIFADRGAL